MSQRCPLLSVARAVALFVSVPSAAIAGSVLVSNPNWQFIGPRPIAGVQANYGGVILNAASFHATGRVTSIAADLTGGGTCGAGGSAGACRIFVGTAGGGLWMTTDGGNTFTKITGILDPNVTSYGAFPQATVGSVALNPSTSPATIYLGTGEGNLSDSFWGDGIFSSGNLGSSWSQIAGSVSIYNGLNLPANKYEGFTKLAVDPTHSPAYIYAAATFTTSINRAGLQGFSQTYPGFWGIWRSTDGGSTFTQYSVSQMGGCADINNDPCTGDDVVIDPSTNYVYAAVHDGAFNSGKYAVMRSTDSGNTWTSLSLPGISQGQVGRISLAASGGTVYVMVGSFDKATYLGFFKSADSGASWTTETVPCINVSGSGVIIDGTSPTHLTNSYCKVASTWSQSVYDQALAIQPGSSGNTVAFGGVGAYVSTNSGAGWIFLGTSTGPHEDVHALQFDPFNPNILYAGTDGGLFEIDVTTDTVTALNDSIVAAQLYSIGPRPIGTSSPSLDANTFLAGLQDDGTTLSSPSPTASPTPSLQWFQVRTGDGSFTLYDSQNPSLAYQVAHSKGTVAPLVPNPAYSTQSGAFGSWNSSSTPSSSAGAQAFAPLAVDPSVSQFVLLGSFYTYASANGMQTWTQQTTQDLTRGCILPGSAPCAVTDLSFAPTDHTKGYAVTGITNYWTGSAPGGFYVWHTGGANLTSGTTWNEITGNLRNNNTEQSYTMEPGGLTVDPHNAGEVYLGLQYSPLQSTTTGGSFVTNGIASLYKASPNGSSTTWEAADGSSKGVAPINGPVYKVLVDNTDSTSKHLLAGTAAGLFMSSDGGANWTPYNAGGVIPNVPVLDIEQNSAGQIYVATHGAGAYKLAVPTYVGRSVVETAESTCPNPCTIKVTPPNGAQPGDAFLLVLSAAGTYSTPPSGPADWAILPFANQGGAEEIVSSDSYGPVTFWVFAHIFSSTDPTSYAFTLTLPSYSEFIAYLVSYRGASEDFSTYTLYGYPTTADSKTVYVGQLTNVPANATLVNIFQATTSETNEDSGITATFSVPAGSPSLTAESPLTVVLPALTADVFTGPAGGTFGGYSTSDGNNGPGPNTGFQILVPRL